MDTLLLVVTLVSLAVAVGSSLVAWRLYRDTHVRADARVAALEAALAEAPPDGPIVTSSRFDARAPLADHAMDSFAAEPTPVPTGMFGNGIAQESRAKRLVPAIVVGALLVGGVTGALMLVGSANESETATAASAAAPLELLSLRHVNQAGTLTITGLVRNPAGAAQIDRATAMVFLFDQAGGFLTSARVPLDLARLSGGDESPFEIRTPAPAGVARFRVSFRRDDGAVIPHVDRRPPSAAAGAAQ